MIEVEKLTIGWGSTVLLQDMGFRVDRGEVFVILGGSGCGKSTLLRHLIGLELPMAGRIEVDGQAPMPESESHPPNYGVLFQSGALLGSMTLGENLSLPLRRWTELPSDAIEAIVKAKLCLVGLAGFENHLPAEISGGMKKRAGIARALIMDPPLLFLDEPSAGLDPITAVELDELILTLNRSLKTTMVIVTHELESIFKVADRCVVLDKAKKGILAQGNPRDMKESSDSEFVRHFFNRRPMGVVT